MRRNPFWKRFIIREDVSTVLLSGLGVISCLGMLLVLFIAPQLKTLERTPPGQVKIRGLWSDEGKKEKWESFFKARGGTKKDEEVE